MLFLREINGGKFSNGHKRKATVESEESDILQDRREDLDWRGDRRSGSSAIQAQLNRWTYWIQSHCYLWRVRNRSQQIYHVKKLGLDCWKIHCYIHLPIRQSRSQHRQQLLLSVFPTYNAAIFSSMSSKEVDHR